MYEQKGLMMDSQDILARENELKPQQDSTSNISIITKALQDLGYSWSDVCLDNVDYRQFKYDGRVRWTTYMQPALAYPMIHRALSQISRNKTAATDYVESKGHVTPKSVTVTTGNYQHSELENLLEKSQALVVKPVYGSLSRGVTRNISDAQILHNTVKAALLNDDCVIVQQQFYGDEVRLVVVDGVLAAAVLRQRPQVIGDGEKQLRQLIEQENAQRGLISDTMVSYPMLNEINCDMPNLNLDSVPYAGETVVLGYGSMIANGASVYDVMDVLAAGYKHMSEDIASSMGAKFLVVDVITRDPHNFTDYCFLEFNTSPVLKLFYSCRDGQHADVAPILANAIHKITK